MGPDNFTWRIFPSPSSSQLPVMPETMTVEGPVTVKSLPSAARELQRILFEKTSCSEVGAHLGGVMLSRGVGGGIPGLVKGTKAPAGMAAPQLSSKVLLSVPSFAVSV